jgi:hypothetical protein
VAVTSSSPQVSGSNPDARIEHQERPIRKFVCRREDSVAGFSRTNDA